MNLKYTPKIGMEIHIQPKTESKMFCRCKNEFNALKPNKNICEICTGQPGTLPAANKEAVKLIIKAGLALNCQISPKVHWDRKHYFYPDLPKGYQLTQNETPLCKNGYLECEYEDEKGAGAAKKILINRLHLEEDAGKDTHPQGADYSLVDFNRAGAPLIELVTEPVIENKEQAAAFCKELQKIFRYLKVSDADMEKGQMRCEVNISLGKNGKDGTKVEVKNINSFKGVVKSIEYEIKRQSELLDKSQKVIQETRGWNADKQKTLSQRGKEEAHDYRYFPEPDIPPLNITKGMIKTIKNSIVELPNQKKRRFIKNYNITKETAEIIVNDLKMAAFFENSVSELKAWIKSDKQIDQKETPKLIRLCANYLTTDLAKLVGESSRNFGNLKITEENFAELMLITYKKQINSSAAQTVLNEMFKKGGDPSQIIEEKNLKVEENQNIIVQAVEEVIKENPRAVEDFKNGKEKSLQFLMGQVMKKTKGKADPGTAIELIKSKI